MLPVITCVLDFVQSEIHAHVHSTDVRKAALQKLAPKKKKKFDRKNPKIKKLLCDLE